MSLDGTVAGLMKQIKVQKLPSRPESNPESSLIGLDDRARDIIWELRQYTFAAWGKLAQVCETQQQTNKQKIK